MVVINAEDLILGRLAAFVAKQALLGETVDIVNAEKAVITGDKKKIIAEYKRKRDLGAPLIGPYFPRMPDRLMKRAIRGMLDYKSSRGKEAFARIKCHVGVPSSFEGAKFVDVPNANVEKTHAKYLTIGRISKELGAKF